MEKIKRKKILTCFCIIILALTFTGCADHTFHSKRENTHQVQRPEHEGNYNNQYKEETTKESAESDTEVESEATSTQKPKTDSETETGIITYHYEPVTVSQIDYDSFQSRMTPEEWAGFQQYFPVLKENAAFELANRGHYTLLNKDGGITEDENLAVFYRYDSRETTDLRHFVKGPYEEGDDEEMMISEVQVLDLDGDGIQELILNWTPAGDFLILHSENGKFYGWEIAFRGFEMLQTNGIYLSSGGAACNHWKQLRFDNGSWFEEELAAEDWGEYFINGESVDEETYRQQIAAYESGDVTGYMPKRCVYIITD